MGIGHLFRAGRRVRVRRQGMGAAAAALMLAVNALQRRLARRRQGYRRQGDQGPQGQARRHRGRRAGAEPERLRRPRLRRADQGRRQAGRVLQLRRDVEGHASTTRSTRPSPRPSPARPRKSRPRRAAWSGSADAARRQGRLGAPAQDRAVLQPAHRDLRRRHHKTDPLEMPAYPYPIFMAYASSRPTGLQPHQGDDRGLRRLQGRGAGRRRAWTPRARISTWVVPYHEGAVKALKEAGVWKAEHDAHNQKLMKRQAGADRGLDGLS